MKTVSVQSDAGLQEPVLRAWQRHTLPEEYRHLDSKCGTPLNCVDGLPLAFSMAPVRKLVQINETGRSAIRNVDSGIFWGEFVAEIADVWSREDVRSSVLS